MLEWPCRRFEAAFSAWQKRKAVDDLKRQKELRVSAVWSNSNWDSRDADREGYLRKLDAYYDEVESMIVTDPEVRRREQEIVSQMEENDPFLRSSRRNLARVSPPEMPGTQSIRNLPE